MPPGGCDREGNGRRRRSSRGWGLILSFLYSPKSPFKKISTCLTANPKSLQHLVTELDEFNQGGGWPIPHLAIPAGGRLEEVVQLPQLSFGILVGIFAKFGFFD